MRPARLEKRKRRREGDRRALHFEGLSSRSEIGEEDEAKEKGLGASAEEKVGEAVVGSARYR